MKVGHMWPTVFKSAGFANIYSTLYINLLFTNKIFFLIMLHSYIVFGHATN